MDIVLAVDDSKWTDEAFLDDLVLNCLWPAWERFWLHRGELFQLVQCFGRREKLLGKGKMSSSPHYNTIYLKLSYQSLSSSNRLQLLYALLFLAGCLFVDSLATFVALLMYCCTTVCDVFYVLGTEKLQPMKLNEWFKFCQGSQSVARYWKRKSHLCSDQ